MPKNYTKKFTRKLPTESSRECGHVFADGACVGTRERERKGHFSNSRYSHVKELTL